MTLLRVALLGSMALSAFAAPNNALLDVRIGTHKQFDRVVFELQSALVPSVKVKDGQRIEVRFSGVNVPQNFSLPSLPPDLTILKRIDAFREGEDILFDLTLVRDATPTELPLMGTPWRLAIDLAPRTAAAPPEKKPEYIPGDLPIPTKLAGEDVTEAPEDPAQAHAVLAYFYLDRGDTANAAQEALAYQQITGKALDLSARTVAKATPTPPPPRPQSAQAKQGFWPKKWPKLVIPTPVIWLIIFGGGLLGGLAIRGGIRPPRLRMPKLPQRKKKPQSQDMETELSDDLQALEEAVAQEPPRKAAPAAPPPPERELIPEPVLEEEQEVRESLMDRRVRRVLELNREGRSVTDIAEELQMGQDEVKLILDLNQ
ncbi:MAG TPA: hypothetical protein VGL38_10030 [bacterium]|jgi:hypothetical protein